MGVDPSEIVLTTISVFSEHYVSWTESSIGLNLASALFTGTAGAGPVLRTTKELSSTAKPLWCSCSWPRQSGRSNPIAGCVIIFSGITDVWAKCEFLLQRFKLFWIFLVCSEGRLSRIFYEHMIIRKKRTTKVKNLSTLCSSNVAVTKCTVQAYWIKGDCSMTGSSWHWFYPVNPFTSVKRSSQDEWILAILCTSTLRKRAIFTN